MILRFSAAAALWFATSKNFFTKCIMGAARLINCLLSKFAWEFAVTDLERFLQPVATLPRICHHLIWQLGICLLVTTRQAK